MTDDALRCFQAMTPDERAENVALTVQSERLSLLDRATTYRRQRTAQGASISELSLIGELIDAEIHRRTLEVQVEELLDERDNHRYSHSPADPRLRQMHQLAREATRTDSTSKATRAARDELVDVALALFPEAPNA